MLVVEYNPNFGKPIRDGEAESYAKQIFHRSQLPNAKGKKLFSASISHLDVIESLQSLIKDKIATPKQIKFRFQKSTVGVLPSGKFKVSAEHPFFKLNSTIK